MFGWSFSQSVFRVCRRRPSMSSLSTANNQQPLHLQAKPLDDWLWAFMIGKNHIWVQTSLNPTSSECILGGTMESNERGIQLSYDDDDGDAATPPPPRPPRYTTRGPQLSSLFADSVIVSPLRHLAHQTVVCYHPATLLWGVIVVSRVWILIIYFAFWQECYRVDFF